jgi:hypothetical protein
MPMKIGSNQVDEAHRRIERRDFSAPALVQCRPAHLNFDLDPGLIAARSG